MMQRSNSRWLIILAAFLLPVVAKKPPFEVQCDFGESKYHSNFSVAVTGSLTAHFGNARQCLVTHRVSSAIVRVFLNTYAGTSNITGNISVLYTAVLEKTEVLTIGSADSTYLDKGQKYHFHICPRENKVETNLTLLIFGIPENGTFRVQVELDQSYLATGKNSSSEVHVREDGLAQVLSLDVEEDHLFELYQITAKSLDKKMECILIVSQDCLAVQRQVLGGIGSSKGIWLTFTAFGRITLSQYSHPKIAIGRWHIGVYAKRTNVTNTHKKLVEITVKSVFKYSSMVGKNLPAFYMLLITFLVGLVIAVFAHFLLNSDFEKTDLLFSDEEDENVGLKPAKKSKKLPGKSIKNYIPEPMPRKTFPFKGWVKVISIQWFGKGLKTYPYITGVLAISFMVGSAQFVIARWSNMIESGFRDICYYNEGCYRPIAISDIPSNFLLSNVPYVILGILLSLSFSLREAISREHQQCTSCDKASSTTFVPYDYSLPYAFSWALVFEGLFSATYHLCPSRLTFQFDSAFMFIISGLVVVALYNSRVRWSLSSNQDDTSSSSKSPSDTIIQAPKYFLFFVAPLLVLNYVGSVRDTEGLPLFLEVAYWIALVGWLIAMYCWAFMKLGVPCRMKDCCTPEGFLKWFWFISFLICLVLIGAVKLGDWSQFFLFSCVAAVALSIMGLMTFNLTFSFKRLNTEGIGCCSVLKLCCHPKELMELVICNWHRILFSLVCFLFWVFAMYFFKLKPTTRKVATPSMSRTLNHECVLWNFFDYHDIWHMLSSFALFMSAYLLIYITRKAEKLYFVESQYYKSKMATTTKNLRLNDSQTEANEQGKNSRTVDDEVSTDSRNRQHGNFTMMVSYV